MTTKQTPRRYPRVGRPYMPGYGILEPDGVKGDLLPWTWAIDRLAKAHNFFLATTRLDGRPHVMPVWGVWLDGCFCFGTGQQSRKAQNLAANARCVICPENAARAVIVEGVAEPLTGAARFRKFAAALEVR